jgi:dihydroxyacetone kinase
MNGVELVALVDRTLELLAERTEELRDLDAAVGDGDLGITVGKGCEAVRARLQALEDPTPVRVVKAAGVSAANANPSTMAALVGGGLLAGGRVLGEADSLGRAEVLPLARAIADSVATRGKSAVGDKTILDAMVPSIDALEAAPAGSSVASVLGAMIDAARGGVESTTALQNQRGRAAWLGERSAGHPDPGATAYLRFLEALATAWTARDNPPTGA